MYLEGIIKDIQGYIIIYIKIKNGKEGPMHPKWGFNTLWFIYNWRGFKKNGMNLLS